MKFPERFSNLPDYAFLRPRAHDVAALPKPLPQAAAQVCMDDAHIAANRGAGVGLYLPFAKGGARKPGAGNVRATMMARKDDMQRRANGLATACITEDRL